MWLEHDIYVDCYKSNSLRWCGIDVGLVLNLLIDCLLLNVWWQIFHEYSWWEQFNSLKNTIQKWKGNGTTWAIIVECNWKSMEIWVGTKNLVFCSDHNVPSLSRNLQKRCLSMEWAWHSPKTLPTMLYGQAFYIVTWNLLIGTI